MESGTVNLLKMLQDRVKKLCEDGKWDEAMHAATAAVDKSRATLDDDPQSIEKLSASLEVKGDFLRQYGYLEDSRKSYLEALDSESGQTGHVATSARRFREPSKSGCRFIQISKNPSTGKFQPTWYIAHRKVSALEDVAVAE